MRERKTPYPIDHPKVKKLLDDLEAEAYYPIHWQSGAYAEANLYDYDEDFFYVELKFGVQSDCCSECYTEEYEVDRLTLEIRN